MSTTGLINTNADWSLISTAGTLVLNYNYLTRQSPAYSTTFSSGVTNVFTLIPTDAITTDGIYLITVSADFSSTPWNTRIAFFMPLGFTALANDGGLLKSATVASYHAQNGVFFNFSLKYLAIGVNYQRPGVLVDTYNNCATGSWTVKAYRFV